MKLCRVCGNAATETCGFISKRGAPCIAPLCDEHATDPWVGPGTCPLHPQSELSDEQKQCRRTPPWLFEELQEFFGYRFRLDAYASTQNALCQNFYTEAEDGNAQPWLEDTFANPEFDDMATPTCKAVMEADERNIRSVMIAPVGCSQGWYHRWAIRGTIWVPDRRINFDEPDGTPTKRADRDTIILAFGGKHVNEHWAQGQFRIHALNLKGKR